MTGFAELLDLLGYQPADPVTVCHQPAGGVFATHWTTAQTAPVVAAGYAASENVWFGINGVWNRGTGRGRTQDVTRLACMWADLDVKPGGMSTGEAAVEVIRTLSTMLGSDPVAIVSSGHGFQPYWALDPADPLVKVTDDTRGDAVALARRFGRLVAHVAELHGGSCDSVFDLARVLRVPGTWNRKADPVQVTVSVCAGRPLTVAEVDEALAAYNVTEQPDDRDDHGEITAPRGDWTWSTSTQPAVTRAIASWATQTPKARHPWLLGAATSLAFAHRLGWVTEHDHAGAVQVLTGRFRWLLANTQERRQPAPGEIAGCFAHGVSVAERKNEAAARADWAFWTERAGTVPPAAEQEDQVDDELEVFWNTRPELTAIHGWARARRCAPLAVLGGVLARVSAATPAFVKLPALVGGPASLNLFVGLVGPSGLGKGGAMQCAEHAVDVSAGEEFEVTGPGSGEGIGHLFYRWDSKTRELDQHTRSVLLEAAEVDTLAALKARQGSNLLPELRKAWSGEQLGFGYANEAKRLKVPRHSYRLGLVVGIQPDRARPLLDEANGGTPQRFLWLPALDPDMPAVRPAEPARRFLWRRPERWHPGLYAEPIPVCSTAANAVDAAAVARHHGEVDALDGHALLCQLKVAALLGILNGRAEVSEDDWRLAGWVMRQSDRTRGRVVATLNKQTEQANKARAEQEADREVVKVNRLEDVEIRKTCQVIMAKVGSDWVAASSVRRGLSKVRRPYFWDAVDRIVSTGELDREDGSTGAPDGAAGARIRRSQGRF